MTKRQKNLGVTTFGYEQGIKQGEFLSNFEAFKAKAATIRKGQYYGIDIIKSWFPEYAEYQACAYTKLEQAQPFFFGLTARLPDYFNYSNTNGLDVLTVR